MSVDDLCYMSAHEALKRFRDLSLSPLELVEAIIEKAELIADTVNPFADRYFEEAIDRAKKSEALYAQRTADIGPIEGVPLAVKDLCEIVGNAQQRDLLSMRKIFVNKHRPTFKGSWMREPMFLREQQSPNLRGCLPLSPECGESPITPGK